MLDQKLPKAIIYLEPHQVSIYLSTSSVAIAIPFTGEVVANMEVIAVETLQAQIETGIKQNDLQPHLAHVVISPGLYFKKEFPGKEKSLRSPEITAFLDIIPLENVTSRVIAFHEAAVAVATNKDFYQPILDVFKRSKFEFAGLPPAFVFQDSQEEQFQFTPEMARKILGQWDLAQKMSLVNMQPKTTSSQIAQAQLNSEDGEVLPLPSDNTFKLDNSSDEKLLGVKRVYVLAGVFIVLILILSILVYNVVLNPQPV